MNVSPVLINATRSQFGGQAITTEEWRGKSTDTKPLRPADRHGSVFYELDTQNAFMFDGELLAWVLQ